jgi:hypothetical protein
VVNSDQEGSEEEACTTVIPSQICGQDSKVDEPRHGNLTGSKRKQVNSSNQIRQRTTTSKEECTSKKI